MRRSRLLGGALGLALAFAVAGPATADVRRVEVTGTAPTGAQAPRGKGSPRDAALAAAIRGGVERVARQQLRGRPPADLKQVLGDPRAYTVRYKILEDRGDQPASGGGRERVLRVEVHVDGDRLERRLAEAGLLGNAPPIAGESFSVILEDLTSYGALEGVREALVEAGALRAVPSEVTPGRVALEVEASGSPRRLIDRVVSLGRARGLEIRVLEQGGSRVRLRVRQAGVSSPRGRR